LESATWYAAIVDGHRHYSPAGYWYAYVSIPIYQFLLARWYFRIFIWVRFLCQVSKLDLHLVPTHPDRARGSDFSREAWRHLCRCCCLKAFCWQD